MPMIQGGRIIQGNEVYGPTSRTKNRMKKTLQSTISYSEKKCKRNYKLFFFIQFGYQFCFAFNSKRLELKEGGLQHWVRNSK